jgi:uncharacterized repeat protein (TIGR03809 family)
MTHRQDVVRGRNVVARWCALAEQRLEYLTELFETGRWRRFHSETAFLENIREAKAAVETWRDLLTREASPDNSAIDMSWLSRVAPPRQAMPTPARRPAPIAQPSPRPIVVKSADIDRISSDEASFAPVVAAPVMEIPAIEVPAFDNTMELLMDLDAIERRYPLLRNAM